VSEAGKFTGENASRRLLVWLYKRFHQQPFRTKMVAAEIGGDLNYVSGLIGNLKGWGILRYKHRTKRGWGGYEITQWGEKCARRWKDEGV
jgi:hypothetical protein